MRKIAELSGGQFFTAATEQELRQVYAELGEQIGYEVRRVDTSRPWLAGGSLLLIVGVVILGLIVPMVLQWRHRRVPDASLTTIATLILIGGFLALKLLEH